MLDSRRGAIGTRLLNLNDVDNDHPEPMVQDIWPGGTGGDPFFSARQPGRRYLCMQALQARLCHAGIEKAMHGLHHNRALTNA